MTNYPFRGIQDFDDIEAKNGYKADVVTGKVNAEDYLGNLRHMSRDNARTPMQWDATTNGGFTTAAKPWLPVNPNYVEINAAQEVADPDSIYRYTQRMIEIRRHAPALVYGDYKDLDPSHPAIFAYTRSLNAERYLVVLNFSKDAITWTIPSGLAPGSMVIGNRPGTELTRTLHLQGWEARVYKF